LASSAYRIYSACLLLAFLSGYLLARWRATRVGVAGRHIDNVSLLIPPISLFGARFFSWLFYQPAGTGFIEGMLMDGGGLVFYGGLIFAVLTVRDLYACEASLSARDGRCVRRTCGAGVGDWPRGLFHGGLLLG
jgi:prolipoprotein diacylglyceryltransferase